MLNLSHLPLFAQHVWVTKEALKSNEGRLGRKMSLLVKESSTGNDDDDDDDDPKPQCAICLCPYQNGDDICFSQNDQCNHAFHKVCLVAWLRKHEDCPCCRLKYVCTKSADDDSSTTTEDLEC